METREDILKMVKEQTGWTDDECEAWLQQEEKMQGEVETTQVWYAYYIENENTGRRRYGVETEEVYTKKYMDKAYDHYRCFSEAAAKDKLREWKDSHRY